MGGAMTGYAGACGSSGGAGTGFPTPTFRGTILLAFGPFLATSLFGCAIVPTPFATPFVKGAGRTAAGLTPYARMKKASLAPSGAGVPSSGRANVSRTMCPSEEQTQS